MVKIFKTGFLIVPIMILLSVVAKAADGVALMKIEHGARPAGMGAAFVSITNDPNGTTYNPAGIIGITKFTASFGHTSYWENVRLESGYFAVNLSSKTFLHGGLRFAMVDDLERRDIPSVDPEDLFDAHDVSFKTGLTYLFSEKVALGLSAGWFFEKIESWRGSAFNLDIGAIIKPKPGLNLGASVTNLGSDFSLTKPGVEGSREISLPTTYTVGGSYQYDRYLGALDIVVIDDEAHVHLGAESRVHEFFMLRAGYMFNYDSKNITAGASFTKNNLTVDYAFVPYTNELGTSHIFNFTFSL